MMTSHNPGAHSAAIFASFCSGLAVRVSKTSLIEPDLHQPCNLHRHEGLGPRQVGCKPKLRPRSPRCLPFFRILGLLNHCFHIRIAIPPQHRYPQHLQPQRTIPIALKLLLDGVSGQAPSILGSSASHRSWSIIISQPCCADRSTWRSSPDHGDPTSPCQILQVPHDVGVV